mmetsp:Transcript_117998/g.205437  ORF Transcript_117998/g.205437 Transcript_117998/m.205437 type:complete len:81 (-) Transcript_117998:1564-1806(-)
MSLIEHGGRYSAIRNIPVKCKILPSSVCDCIKHLAPSNLFAAQRHPCSFKFSRNCPSPGKKNPSMKILVLEGTTEVYWKT